MTMKWKAKAQRFRKFCHRVLEAWTFLHVEFQGSYSEDRIRQLHSYTNDLTTKRLVLVCLLTPLPSVCLSLLSEVVPLQPLEAGMAANWFLFVRSWILIALIGAGVLVQIGQGAPQLKLAGYQIVFVSFLSATVSIIFIVVVCAMTVFPIPFGSLAVAPPDVFIIAACFIYISGPKLRANPSLWIEIKRQLSVFNCQVALTFVYPLYIYGYVSLRGYAQAFFVLVSPVIQLIAKNWTSRELTNHHHIKPETIVFVVEIFNVLYISNALQTNSLWKSTVLIIGTDHVQFWLAMFDITKCLDEVKLLLKKIPRGHPAAKENFVQIAERLMNFETKLHDQSTTNNSTSSTNWQSRIKAWVRLTNRPKPEPPSQRVATMKLKNDPFTGRKRGPKVIISQARVFPMRPPQHQHWLRRNANAYSNIVGVDTPASGAPELGVEAIFTREERTLFILKTSQVLFTTEYVMLVEYIELAMQLVFSVHRLVLFHMPNSPYYPFLSSCSSVQLYSSVLKILVYASLEFVSLVMIIFVLKRTLGFSTLSQLVFVLEKQASTI